MSKKKILLIGMVLVILIIGTVIIYNFTHGSKDPVDGTLVHKVLEFSL